MDFIFRNPPNTKLFSEKRRFWTFLPTKSQKMGPKFQKSCAMTYQNCQKIAVFELLLIYLQKKSKKSTFLDLDFVGKK